MLIGDLRGRIHQHHLKKTLFIYERVPERSEYYCTVQELWRVVWDKIQGGSLTSAKGMRIGPWKYRVAKLERLILPNPPAIPRNISATTIPSRAEKSTNKCMRWVFYIARMSIWPPKKGVSDCIGSYLTGCCGGC